jgi:hypothetical protein
MSGLECTSINSWEDYCDIEPFSAHDSSSCSEEEGGSDEMELFSLRKLLNMETRSYVADEMCQPEAKLKNLKWVRNDKGVLALDGLASRLRQSFLLTFNANLGRKVLVIDEQDEGRVTVNPERLLHGENATSFLQKMLRGEGPIPFRLQAFSQSCLPQKIDQVLERLNAGKWRAFNGWSCVGVRPSGDEKNLSLLWERVMGECEPVQMIESGYITQDEYHRLWKDRTRRIKGLPTSAQGLFERGELLAEEKQVFKRFRAKINSFCFRRSGFSVHWIEKHPLKQGVWRALCFDLVKRRAVLGPEFTLMGIGQLVSCEPLSVSESDREFWEFYDNLRGSLCFPKNVDRLMRRRIDVSTREPQAYYAAHEGLSD